VAAKVNGAHGRTVRVVVNAQIMAAMQGGKSYTEATQSLSGCVIRPVKVETI
jgi:hypothetical protein